MTLILRFLISAVELPRTIIPLGRLFVALSLGVTLIFNVSAVSLEPSTYKGTISSPVIVSFMVSSPFNVKCAPFCTESCLLSGRVSVSPVSVVSVVIFSVKAA